MRRHVERRTPARSRSPGSARCRARFTPGAARKREPHPAASIRRASRQRLRPPICSSNRAGPPRHAERDAQRAGAFEKRVLRPFDRRPRSHSPDAPQRIAAAALVSGPLAARVVNCEKLPCVPRRSGVHIAESSRPSNFSGGNVMGTRRMVLPMPCSPRIFQKGGSCGASRRAAARAECAAGPSAAHAAPVAPTAPTRVPAHTTSGCG